MLGIGNGRQPQLDNTSQKALDSTAAVSREAWKSASVSAAGLMSVTQGILASTISADLGSMLAGLADGPWVTQRMRHAPEAEDGCLRPIRVLIHDRDPRFRPAGRDPLPPADVTPIRRPARAPNLNADTARFVRTIKDSCLARMVRIGEGARRRAVREFVAHDHHERNHQGLDNRLTLPLSTAPPPRGRVQGRQPLGGMLHDSYRSAA